MNTNFIRRSILNLVFILLASVASAKELKSDELNYTITVPDDWTVKSQDQTGFYIKSQDGKRSMNLAIVPVGSTKLDSSYIAKFEQVLQKTHHLQLVSSRIFTIDGVPAYENIQRLGEAPIASVQVEHQIIADGRLYDLTTLVISGDATQDSEMQVGLASFHFLQQPKPSRSGSPGVKLTVVGIIMAGIVFWVIRSGKTEI